MTLSNAPVPATIARERRRVTTVAREAVRSHWIARLTRFGLVTRGIIYFIPGVFALEWALGRHQETMTPAGTIDFIGQQPLGRLLLGIVAVGLAGYALWGIIRVVLDPQRRGHSISGIAQRIGYATSAAAYLALLVATFRLLAGGHAPIEGHTDWTTSILARPFGVEIVVGIGLCWVFGSGIAQILTGWRGAFARDFVPGLSGIERGWAIGLGRTGMIARGVVFTLIGVLIVTGALHLYKGSGNGLGGALLTLSHQPFGRALLAAAGLGLMAFGTFSAMSARWMRVREAASDRASAPPHRQPS